MSKSFDYHAAMMATHEPQKAHEPPKAKRTMAQIKTQSLRRAAILRELASLGLHASAVARLTGMSDGYLCIFRKRHGLEFSRAVPETALRRAIRKGYSDRKSPRDIAAELGTSYGVVKVLASKMKITVRDPQRFARGFSIPPDRRAEYRGLTRLGCTPQEAGMTMRLIPRPPLEQRSVPRYAGAEEARS